MTIFNQLIQYLRKPKLFTFILMWMMFLIVIGTLAQKDMGLFAVQNKYFSSWIIWFWYLPMPGGRLTMILMSINLMFFIFSKTLWKVDKLGLLILHLGGLLMLIGGGLTAIFSSEGNIVIDEGAKSNFIEDYYLMELAIINTSNMNYDFFTIFDAPLLKPGKVHKHKDIPLFKNQFPIIKFTNMTTSKILIKPSSLTSATKLYSLLSTILTMDTISKTFKIPSLLISPNNCGISNWLYKKLYVSLII